MLNIPCPPGVDPALWAIFLWVLWWTLLRLPQMM